MNNPETVTSSGVIFVDVDDTLVRSVGTKRIPIPSVVSKVRALHERAVVMYLWSSGGAEYAEASARELGISDCFMNFLPKPDAYIDDQSVADWRFCEPVLPQNAENL